MAGVTLKNVSKSYAKGNLALSDVSLEIRDQEFVVLVGPSGCGKSTILRTVAGLEEATQGEVLIGDRVVNNVPPKDRDVAMVFQNYALYPHMTAYDNIAFGLKIRRMPKSEIDKRVRDAARVLNIDALLGKMPRALSGGERQRVALGRAIVRNPRVFLFDEPLSNLDAKLRSEMRAEISALHQRLRVTTIYVTHDQVEAMTMGERIVVLKDGLIHQVGRPMDVYRTPINRFVASFIGSPSMNFLEARVDDGAGALSVEGSRFELPQERRAELGSYANRGIILGIRPEHLDLAKDGGLPARVNLIEPTGGDSFVFASVAESSVVVRLPGDADLHIGEEVRLGVDLANAHCFDPESEMRIGT